MRMRRRSSIGWGSKIGRSGGGTSREDSIDRDIPNAKIHLRLRKGGRSASFRLIHERPTVLCCRTKRPAPGPTRDGKGMLFLGEVGSGLPDVPPSLPLRKQIRSLGFRLDPGRCVFAHALRQGATNVQYKNWGVARKILCVKPI